MFRAHVFGQGGLVLLQFGGFPLCEPRRVGGQQRRNEKSSGEQPLRRTRHDQPAGDGEH